MSENSIELVIAQNPVLAITDKAKFEELLKGIRAEIDAHVPDVSTPKGRKEIASLAYKVTRTKTAIDDAGKELNAEKRREIDKVDAERREIRAKLEGLADEVRKPLTDWEDAEEKRQERAKEILNELSTLAYAEPGIHSSRLEWQLRDLDMLEIDPEIFQDDLTTAVLKKDAALSILKGAIESAKKYEADQAELQKLRDEAAAREAAETARLAKEQEEKDAAAKREREQAEAEQREKDRLAAIAEAAENARRQEAAKAKAEQDERDRVAQEAIDKANRQRDELIAAQKREREQKEATERAEREAQEARDKDRKHRGEVMKAAKEAIMQNGADEDTARKIVLAIIANEIPNVSLRF